MPVIGWLASLGLALSVWSGGRWAPLSALSASLHWRDAAPGLSWSQARLSGPGEAYRIRLIVARLDPRKVRFRLDTLAPWSIEQAPAIALLAINAGQFANGRPWGWIVADGRVRRTAGTGPLSVGIAFDTSGTVHWVEAGALRDDRAQRGVSAGFQSYPRLLADGVVPLPLREEGRGVDLTHRDARAALGQTAEGTILVALTRFDGAGGALGFVPFGLTVPEMAAVMESLGARNAVLLDGGISSQLLIREGREVRRWRGLRKVPVGLVVLPR
jgi:exopolysaccharide biosynthesis protein